MEHARPDSWYRIRTVDHGITWIDEPFIHEFYRCNIWHVRGRDRDMVVDSGMGVVGLRARFVELRERTCIAVASHTHFDHVGNHHEFDDRLVHREESDILAAPTRPNTLADPYVTDDIFTRLPPPPYRSVEYRVRAAPATRVLDDGDVVDLGDRRFEIIHAPGHSPGSIMLWENATGVLFSGDTVYDGPLIDDAYHSDVDAYVATMKRILDLPVRVVHGGHYPSFDGGRYRELIRRYLDDKGA
jgi:glyoxylase-like metal-dependent hydrolase (beta-lactamase superfamily II)